MFTSLLTRTRLTVSLLGLPPSTPVTHDWRLNERHYGALTGLNKAACVKEHGSEQVNSCRT